MVLSVSPVTSVADFSILAPLDYDAWRSPYNPQLKHFRTIFPTRAETIAATEARSIQRLLENDPNRFLIKVTDTESNEIIGSAVWVLNDPEKTDGEKTVASWHPKDSEEREFAEVFIDGLWGYLWARVTRKHMDLHSIIVHVAHRHRGAGRMLLRWGTAKADELGIETVISSLKSARGAYEKSGFGYIEEIPPDPKLYTRLEELEKEGRGQKWKELLEDDLTGLLLWRPVGRDWKEGDSAPWTESVESS